MSITKGNRLAALLLTGGLLLGGATTVGANAENGQDNDYAEADAGSFGVPTSPSAEDVGWCQADAGSLGIDDPVGACR